MADEVIRDATAEDAAKSKCGDVGAMKPSDYVRNDAARNALAAAAVRLAREDLSALPSLAEAYKVCEARRDRAGALLAAAYGVQTIAAAYADFRDAQRWVMRMRQSNEMLSLLPDREGLVVCGAIVSAAVIVDTTGFESPAIAIALEDALRLLERNLEDGASNDVVAVGRALLEYCEQQGRPDIFHRVARAAGRYLSCDSLGPLIAGRYLIYDARCRIRLGAYDEDRARDGEAIALLDRVEALGANACLSQLQFDARYARVLLAAIRNETGSVGPLVERMQEVLDYARPNCVALYYQHLSRVHLMNDRVAPAFEAAEHALRAARLAACVSGEQRSYRIMYALALLASGEAKRAVDEIAALVPTVSGRPRAILECTLRFAEAWGARLTGDAKYRDTLHRAMQQAQELNWPLFLNSLPRIAAQLVGDALQFDIGSELARRAIALRKLRAPPDADDRWPWPIRIHTLGRFAVFVDGKALSFTGKAQRRPLELLKLMLAHAGHDLESGKASAELWPDLEGDASRNAFDLALHRLRKLLRHDDVVTMRDGALVIDEQRVWIDARAFERLCAQVENDSASISAQASAGLLLRYYLGHFLAGEDAHWAILMRERLRNKLLRALSALGRRLDEQDNRDEAVLLYQRAIEMDPLAEAFHQRLMLCYRAQGRIAEALDAYRHCRELLSITLGLEPSPATQAVYRSLKQR